MKRKLVIGLFVTMMIVVAAGLQTKRVFAATGCFPDTNGHWAETLICWMKDSGLTGGYPDGTYRAENGVTRAEMAVFLNKLFTILDTKINQTAATLDTKINQTFATLDTKIDQTAATLDTKINQTAATLDTKINQTAATLDTKINQTSATLDTKIDQTAVTLDTKIDQTSTGDILISAGFANWHPFNSTDPLSYTYFSSQTQVSRSASGSSFLSINPDIPPVLYGRSLLFKGVVFCYDTFASTSLNYVEINTYSHVTGSLGRNLRFSDPTTRTGNACRTYTLSSPVVLGPNDGVNFFIQVNWSAASTQFALGRTTFIFAATNTTVAPSLAPASAGADPDVTLQPIPENDTSAP